MARQLLPLCSLAFPTTRDGYTGATARLSLPFNNESGTYQYWFRNGQTIAFPGSTLAQDTSMTIAGQTRADTFVKSYGVCLKG